MAWPTHIQDDNFQSLETGHFCSTIDLENWETGLFKQPQGLYTSPSPEPPTTRRSSTATSYSHTSQLPSTPDSLGSAFSSGLVYSDQMSTNGCAKENGLELFFTQRNDAVISPPSSHELGYTSPWANLAAVPPQKSSSAQPGCLDDPCITACKTPRGSRHMSSKSKNDADYGNFKCEWKGCRYDRMFSRKGVLMRHIEMQHVNPRSFKCPWCNHATSRRENMKAHRQAIHKESL